MLAPGVGRGEPPLLLADAEVRALEQLGGQDHLRAQRCGLADQGLSLGDVGGYVVAIRRLDRGQGERARHQAGSCWEMQWKEPPPVSSALDGKPITVRSGNSSFSASSANAAARSLYVGMTTARLAMIKFMCEAGAARPSAPITRPGEGIRTTFRARPAASVAPARSRAAAS